MLILLACMLHVDVLCTVLCPCIHKAQLWALCGALSKFPQQLRRLLSFLFLELLLACIVTIWCSNVLTVRLSCILFCTDVCILHHCCHYSALLCTHYMLVWTTVGSINYENLVKIPQFCRRSDFETITLHMWNDGRRANQATLPAGLYKLWLHQSHHPWLV